MKYVEKLIHAHSVKNKYTMTDEHYFCKNSADHLIDCILKEYQVKPEATSTNLSSLLLYFKTTKYYKIL